jgi:hypothetical protein
VHRRRQEHGAHARHDPGGRGDAVAHGLVGRHAAVDRLAHPAEDEDVVVHRQPEQDHEEEERQPRDDQAVRLETENRLRPVMLEDEHEQSVRRADGEQVERDRLQGHDDRSERDQQQNEGERKHERDHVGNAALHVVREVDVLGSRARDRRLDARNRSERRRHELGAKPLDGVAARRVVAGAVERELERRRLVVEAAADREGRVREPTGLHELLQVAKLPLNRGRRLLRAGEGYERRTGRARKVGVKAR